MDFYVSHIRADNHIYLRTYHPNTPSHILSLHTPHAFTLRPPPPPPPNTHTQSSLSVQMQYKLPSLLSQHNTKLVVVDSIAAMFHVEFSETHAVQRAQLLRAFGTQLKRLSNDYGAAVVCVNQVCHNGVTLMQLLSNLLAPTPYKPISSLLPLDIVSGDCCNGPYLDKLCEASTGPGVGSPGLKQWSQKLIDEISKTRLFFQFSTRKIAKII